jgi:nicotinamidase-related amidase
MTSASGTPWQADLNNVSTGRGRAAKKRCEMPSHDWGRCALLLIDVQRGFWGDHLKRNFPDFPANVGRLLKLCRYQAIEVIHVRTRFSPDGLDWMPFEKLGAGITCVEGTPSVASTSFAREDHREMVFYKQTLDGFFNPELKSHLLQNRRRFVLAAGLITSVCVLLTAVSATQHGFLTAIVEDCCADDQKAHEFTLNHYSGFSFMRTRLDDIVESHPRWMECLERLDRIGGIGPLAGREDEDRHRI